jgi:ATP-dependent DNA helicase
MVASVFPENGDEFDASALLAMQKVEDEERARREKEEAAAQVPGVDDGVDASAKLAKLDTLLEKAGMYSNFLFSNMASATMVGNVSENEEDEEDEEEEEEEEDDTVRGSRKRGRGDAKKPRGRKKSKKSGEGAAKLSKMQREAQQQAQQQAQQARAAFKQPSLLTGGTLRDYQLEGIRWLCNLFENGLNGILADEMGLGKTIQVIGLIAHLKAQGVRGPFLIAAPLSTLMNWANEFRKWVPSINIVVYHGNKVARRAMRAKQLHKSRRSDANFPVIITSYEMIMQDAKSFNNLGFVWKYVIIDEGHRLKNMDCRLVRELKRARSENRLLLTGTPLQNNLTELWALLNFILPDVFDDLELFESWFSFASVNTTTAHPDSEQAGLLTGDKRAEIVSKLHEILRPFLLRRLKSDVVQDMPSKTEIFVYCPMTALQREYYTMIMNRTLEAAMEAKYGKKLYRTMRASFKTSSLRNRAMQLRKCCNHPYLFDEPTDGNGQLETDERLVQASGKLVVLDRMLRALRREGHKVLIFSQMTRVLDILEDFLDLRGYSHCRLDGSTKLDTRQEQVDAFNKTKAGSAAVADDDSMFCFLLSTRAGGLGINLVSADTVIFFDSDWNPQQDNQAQDRCHRIGQTRHIAVYRLVTENSFENRMLQRAFDKRKLERVVIQRGHFKQQVGAAPDEDEPPKALTNAELEELLRDDVLLRDGVESGGIGDAELAQILDRDLVVRSFATAKEDGKADGQLLPTTGKGYEVVENASAATGMESFS